MATRQIWTTPSSLSRTQRHTHDTHQHGHTTNANAATIGGNKILGHLYRTRWNDENDGNSALEKSEPLYDSVAKNTHVTTGSSDNLPILLSTGINLPPSGDLAIRTISRKNPPTIDSNNPQCYGISSQSPMKHGLCTLKPRRCRALQP